jgi:hypothetical protein
MLSDIGPGMLVLVATEDESTAAAQLGQKRLPSKISWEHLALSGMTRHYAIGKHRTAPLVVTTMKFLTILQPAD